MRKSDKDKNKLQSFHKRRISKTFRFTLTSSLKRKKTVFSILLLCGIKNLLSELWAIAMRKRIKHSMN